MSAADQSRPSKGPALKADPQASMRIDQIPLSSLSGKPDLQAGLEAIRNTLKTLDLVPGVYRMTDANDKVLYVGKAKALKNRVANYTQYTRLTRRIQRMVSLTRNMTIIVTRTEAEALLLEAQLIKSYQPPFNVLLRDGKSFPYIALDMGHKFPRLSKHRGARNPKTRYFGPFASPYAVYNTLNALQKIFLLRSCADSYMANRDRPCLLHQIKRCSAPCVDKVTPAQYGELVNDALEFLTGQSQHIQTRLTDRMQAAAKVQDYELAAILRDRLKALAHIQSGQAVNPEQDGIDADVVAIHMREGVACVQLFFVRNGQNWGHRALFPSHVADQTEDEILTAVLGQFYADLEPAKQILLDRTLPDADLLAQALSERIGRKVALKTPQRGQMRRLVDQAAHNAREAVDRRLAEGATQRRNLEELAHLFGLRDVPQRIEIYDNSHIQGTHALGAMVVATPEGFAKSQYRKYNMKSADLTPGDDFAMMRMMLERRFARLLNEAPDGGEDWPDLLLIDGGKGQVSAAMAALDKLGVEDVAVVGVAKGPDRNAGREIFHFPDGREMTLPPNNPVIFFLQRLRDEAHRFAIGAHRAKRSKALGTSSLDEVPGIGPARKKALLQHFGSARAVKAASLSELEAAPGISAALAQSLYDHFRPNG